MAAAPQLPTREDYLACLAESPRSVATAAGPVEYAERGTGEPVLAVHGTLGGWDQGLASAECLRVNGFRIIAPSRPGYLGTPLSTGRTFAEQGDALAALLDALEIDSIIVFGLSGGGPAAYELASRHSDRVSKLVQVDALSVYGRPPRLSSNLFAWDGVTKAELWFLQRAPKQTLGMLLRAAGSDSGAVVSRRAAELAAIPDRTLVIEMSLRTSLGAARRRPGMRNDFHNFAPADFGRVTCPTLIVHGRSDKTVPPSTAESVHAQIAGSELYWMDGSHTAFGLEAVDTAPAYVVNWLRGDG